MRPAGQPPGGASAQIMVIPAAFKCQSTSGLKQGFLSVCRSPFTASPPDHALPLCPPWATWVSGRGLLDPILRNYLKTLRSIQTVIAMKIAVFISIRGTEGHPQFPRSLSPTPTGERESIGPGFQLIDGARERPF